MNKTILPVEFLSIEEDGFHLFVRAQINNRKAKLLVDTGASKTVFDMNQVRKFVGDDPFETNEKLSTGLGTNSMKTQSVLIRRIKLGELVIRDSKVVLLDLTHVNDSYSKLNFPEIDGVLGSDVLHAYHAVIDYKLKEILLRWK